MTNTIQLCSNFRSRAGERAEGEGGGVPRGAIIADDEPRGIHVEVARPAERGMRSNPAIKLAGVYRKQMMPTP